MYLIDAVDEHYAKFLGVPSAVYSIDMSSHPQGHYQIVEYRNVPFQNAVTFASHGLSEIPLHMFRQEIVFLCYERFVDDDLVALLGVVADMIADNMHPLVQGQVLGPYGPLLKSTIMEALYSAVPTYFPDEFQLIENGPVSIDIGWIIPIYRSEGAWIRQHGWEAFETLLIEHDPDVMDLTRKQLV